MLTNDNKAVLGIVIVEQKSCGSGSYLSKNLLCYLSREKPAVPAI